MPRRGGHGPWWWGAGAPPLECWPGTTIDIPCAWSSKQARWESTDGRYYFDEPMAVRACDFFPDLLRHQRGELAGQPFALLPYQAKLLTRPLFGWKRTADGIRRFQKVFAFLPKGSGKALAVDTPIATTGGWTTMGALRAGDRVFDERGEPCTVVVAHPVEEDRPCARLTFDDGTALVADDAHEWWTEQRYYGNKIEARRLARQRGVEFWRFGIRTTAEIRDTLRYANGQYRSANHSIPLAGPLNLPDAELPIEPYTLGVWLGNGDSDCARVTMGSADAAEMCDLLRATGTSVGACVPTHTAVRVRVGGVGVGGAAGSASLNTALRLAGLLRHKHIPDVYLRASIAQRLALLQGLMDTDGTIGDRGQCEFSVTAKELADGALALILSLGIKATIRESEATLRGRVVGRRWRIGFCPPVERPVFRLRRKLMRQRPYHSRRRLSRDRRVVACEAVPSVPVRCITVDSPSHLFLAGRSLVPTHNSPWGAGTGIFLARCDQEPAAEVYAVANDRDQARTVHDDAKFMIEQSPLLSAGCEVTKNAIVWTSCRATFQVLSSDATGAHGKRPHGVIFDELHGQRDRSLYEALWRSMAKRRQPVLMIITHAGDDDEGICYEEYEYGKNVLGGLKEDASCLPVIFEATAADDWTSPEIWKRVNPGHGVTVTEDGIARECVEAINEPRKRNDFQRYHLNRWVNQAVAWIPIEWWDACDAPLPDDQVLGACPCAVGIDMAQKIDLAAAVTAFKLPLLDGEQSAPVELLTEDDDGQLVKQEASLDYRIALVPSFWLPEETLRDRVKDDHVPYDRWAADGLLTPVEGAIIGSDPIVRRFVGQTKTSGLLARFPRLKSADIAYDPAFAVEVALALRDRHGFTVVEVLQNYKHLNAACQVFEALVKARRIVHGGHRLLRWCAENVAVKRDDAGRIRPVKPRKAAKRIDGVVAAIMAISRIMVLPVERPPSSTEPKLWTPHGWVPARPQEERHA